MKFSLIAGLITLLSLNAFADSFVLAKARKNSDLKIEVECLERNDENSCLRVKLVGEKESRVLDTAYTEFLEENLKWTAGYGNTHNFAAGANIANELVDCGSWDFFCPIFKFGVVFLVLDVPTFAPQILIHGSLNFIHKKKAVRMGKNLARFMLGKKTKSSVTFNENNLKKLSKRIFGRLDHWDRNGRY